MAFRNLTFNKILSYFKYVNPFGPVMSMQIKPDLTKFPIKWENTKKIMNCSQKNSAVCPYC